ncbi:MAG TPA: DUF4442 domain-containing protein [bacterium]|nr:DUF4442 domain-containing protein [bacterium]
MEFGPRGLRRLLNLYPPYLFTRTRVISISADWRESVVQLKKSLLTRNYVGTTFGGSIFAASDPFFMLMLIGIFGIQDHIVWDKAATIEYKRPARSTLTLRFLITDQDIAAIEKDLSEKGKSEPVFYVDAVDREGQVCATVSKTLYVRKK